MRQVVSAASSMHHQVNDTAWTWSLCSSSCSTYEGFRIATLICLLCSVSSSYANFEALTSYADAHDELREEAFMKALNVSARLVLGQFDGVNAAGHKHGVSFTSGSRYNSAVAVKAALLTRIVAAIRKQVWAVHVFIATYSPTFSPTCYLLLTTYSPLSNT